MLTSLTSCFKFLNHKDAGQGPSWPISGELAPKVKFIFSGPRDFLFATRREQDPRNVSEQLQILTLSGPKLLGYGTHPVPDFNSPKPPYINPKP